MKKKKREIFREERGTIKSPPNAVCSSFACCYLSLPVSLFFVCACFSFLSICPPFLFLLLERLSLFIDRFQRSCFLFILSTDHIMEQFSSVFPSQLLISCWAVAHFSAFQAYFHQTVFLTFRWCHFLVHFPAFFFWEMICLQHFYNIFTTNLKWQVVTSYYCWGKKVILMLVSNLNQ